MDTYAVLREAIFLKQPCRISKPSEPERKISPFRLGKSKDGEPNVLYYQYEGYTSRSGGLQPDGSSANWRCNRVSDLADAEIIKEPWHEPTTKPKTRGPCIALLDVEVLDYYD